MSGTKSLVSLLGALLGGRSLVNSEIELKIKPRTCTGGTQRKTSMKTNWEEFYQQAWDHQWALAKGCVWNQVWDQIWIRPGFQLQVRVRENLNEN